MSSFEEQGIAALKIRVSKLEAQVDFLCKHLGLTFSENAYQTDDPRIVDALRRNNMIEAIKLYREQTGLGLKDAKDAVEEMKQRLGY